MPILEIYIYISIYRYIDIYILNISIYISRYIYIGIYIYRYIYIIYWSSVGSPPITSAPITRIRTLRRWQLVLKQGPEIDEQSCSDPETLPEGVKWEWWGKIKVDPAFSSINTTPFILGRRLSIQTLMKNLSECYLQI